MSSSRLKRKLETGQLDSQQYGNLTESFVSVGTALPALTDKKADKNEFKPVWEQEVTDEQGRRRFHGAFTGGFSAGYFNSVGSKEGWTPSTFKSSRANRASQQAQSTADAARAFMDEEDLAELASSRVLETSSSYAPSSSRAAPSKPPAAEYDPLMGLFGGAPPSSSSAAGPPAPSNFDATLASLIAPSSSRVGLKLLRKMGWREGQGVGPRVSLAGRRKQAREIGVALPGDEEEDGDGEGGAGGEAARHLYAPLDRPLTLVKAAAKGNEGWGLGYVPGMTLEAQLRSEGGSGLSARRRIDDEEDYGGIGMAGLGALGERERRAIGVFDDEMDGGEMERMARRPAGGRAARGGEKSAKRSAPAQDFTDGTQVLPGFVLQREPIAGPSTSALPPPPPPGWRPDPLKVLKENAPPSASADVKGKGKGRQLDAEERGTLLGERPPTPPPAVPKSVFDYLSAKSRERLAHATGAPSAAPPPSSTAGTSSNTTPLGGPSRMGSSAASSAPPPPAEPDAQLFVPPLDRPTALAALRGFQPYSTASTSPDPVKQARYTLYLQAQSSGTASTTSSPFGPRVLPEAGGRLQTVSELNRELSEYAQAARVFKPVGGMLGSRFQTSTTGSLDVPKIEPGLYQPPPKGTPVVTGDLASKYGDASSAPSARLKPPEPELTPAQAAARAGNFGPLTRTVQPFRPAKLLCKRFGVRDPYEVLDPSSAAGADEGVGGKWGEATATGWGGEAARTGAAVGDAAIEEMKQSAGFKRFQAAAEAEAQMLADENAPEVAKGAFSTPDFDSSAEAAKARREKARVPPTLETVGLGDDEHQGEEIVREEKAPADIFAAIFADSEDEDEDEEDEEEDEAPDPQPATVLSVDPLPAPSSAVAAAAAPPVSTEPTPTLSADTVASYRPSFTLSTSASASTSASTSTGGQKKDKEKKEKKRKEKRKAGALSFDVGEDGEEEGGGGREKKKEKKLRREREDKEKKRDRQRERSPSPSSRRRDEKRRKEEKVQPAEEEEDEWAEAAPQVHPSILAQQEREREQQKEAKGRKGGRMRAADLY
ncbi:hypothetical protein JCM10213_000007 [Rhodosporidiobolus nylandii]